MSKADDGYSDRGRGTWYRRARGRVTAACGRMDRSISGRGTAQHSLVRDETSSTRRVCLWARCRNRGERRRAKTQLATGWRLVGD